MPLVRHETNLKYGVSPRDQGRLEVGTLLGILANTIPAAFYMLLHVYADHALLQELRDELETKAVSVTADGTSRTLHIIPMREHCPLLHATWQELLRLHAQGASARYVREDTMLNDRYLLKKGMVIQMPTAVMHSDPTFWGPDAQDFQPRRFLKQNDAGAGKASKQYASAYRPFGGGASLCPGRPFVTLEVLALTAWMVLRFDMVPLSGNWRIPASRQESLATTVFPPEEDVRVRIGRRKGFEGVLWDFVVA